MRWPWISRTTADKNTQAAVTEACGRLVKKIERAQERARQRDGAHSVPSVVLEHLRSAALREAWPELYR